LVEGYLSDRHMQATDSGCTLAALGSETRRQSPQIRRVATARVKELVKTIASQTVGHPAAAEPLATLATMVGALLIARVVDDPELAKEVRASATRHVLGKPKKASKR
jgi:TetR/AcrR family transcriptional repressor of nem operon